MKKKITANELTEADVKWVSLVGKGANRLPFKIIKSEDGRMKMQGLDGLFGKDSAESYVASVVVSKDADMHKVESIIKKAGFSIGDKEETKEGLTIFKQAETSKNDDNQYIIKMNEEMGVHVVCAKAFNPTDFETGSFKELFNKAGVLPNIFMAHDILKEVTMNILFSDEIEDSTTASKKVRKAINEFGSIVTGMIESIPVSAFKVENPEILREVKKELEQKEETVEKEKTQKENSVEDTKDLEEKTETTKSDENLEEAVVEEEKQEEIEKSQSEEESENEGDTLSKVAKQLEAIMEKINSLEDSVSGLDSLKEGMSKLEDKVEEVSTVAKGADEAINGTTNATPPDDKSETKKSQSNYTPFIADTGYSRAR